MVFCIKKKLDLDAVVGKSFGTEFGTDAPLDAMLVLCINKQIVLGGMRVFKNMRRQLRNLKKPEEVTKPIQKMKTQKH